MKPVQSRMMSKGNDAPAVENGDVSRMVLMVVSKYGLLNRGSFQPGGKLPGTQRVTAVNQESVSQIGMTEHQRAAPPGCSQADLGNSVWMAGSF